MSEESLSQGRAVTLEDGTPVPDDTEDLRNASDFYGDPTAPNCDNLTVVSYITEILALRERIARAEAREKRLATIHQLTAALERMCEQHGASHDEDCPCDDTCECSMKGMNDQVNRAVNAGRLVLGIQGSAPTPDPEVSQ